MRLVSTGVVLLAIAVFLVGSALLLFLGWLIVGLALNAIGLV